MKTIALILALLISPIAHASSYLPRYWICHQIGYLGKQKVLIASQIAENTWSDYRHRERTYGKVVKKATNNKLLDQFEPFCRDFETKKEAQYFEQSMIKKAHKLGFNIHYVKFDYQGDKHDQSKKN